MPPEPACLTFRPRHRLTHNREFEAVYDANMRKGRGGLVVFAERSAAPSPWPCGDARTLPRAVDRNRAKRLIREWFRLSQHTLSRIGAADSPAEP